MAAVLSHELRTPLNAILGSLSLLDKQAADGNRDALRVERTHLDRMRRNGHHLREMVDGVLTLLRSDATGALQVSPTSGRLDAVVQDALADVEVEALGKDIALVDAVAGSDDDLTYWGDATYVRQILVNLLANAVKFTPHGGRVSIAVGRIARGPAATSEDEIPRVCVSVTDTGRGIPPCDLERIFQPFQQICTSDRHHGAGLGLAISCQLAETMQGAIEVTSEEGVGSTFTLWLPQREP
jgi:signal transduction histidine kinase